MGREINTDLMKFDPKDGSEKPYPSHAEQYRIYHGSVAWLFNPWTGKPRAAEDVGTDCFGHAISLSGLCTESVTTGSDLYEVASIICEGIMEIGDDTMGITLSGKTRLRGDYEYLRHDGKQPSKTNARHLVVYGLR